MAKRKSDVYSSFRFEEATIDGIHEAMRAGQLTARGLVEGYLRRIETYDQKGPEINAIVTVNPNALARADELDQAFADSGEFTGPLHGIPVVLKDNIETNDVTTTYGSIAFDGYQPANDATVTRKLREAGAIILAKTTLPDFATSWWAYSSMSGETRNPYALDCDPGGSSAGTGASVAANFSAVGMGTDCGGSVRVPSSFNNLVGVRSTPGVISRAGTTPLVSWQDTVGPMARTVADAVRMFDVLAGYDPDDSLSVAYYVARAPESYSALLAADALRGARIGFVTNALGSDSDPFAAPVNRVVAAAFEAMRGAGAEVIEVQIPDLMGHIVATSMYVTRSRYETDSFLAARPSAPMRTLQQIYESGKYHPRLDLIESCVFGPTMPEYDPKYYPALVAREEFARAVLTVMAQNGLDALAYPDVQVAPPKRELLNAGQWTTLTFPTNTLIASQTWMPAITVPGGFTEDGLPVGIEFVARPYDEPTMFRLAYSFEQATHHRRPPASAPEL